MCLRTYLPSVVRYTRRLFYSFHETKPRYEAKKRRFLLAPYENESKISTVNDREFTVSLAEFEGLETALQNLNIIMSLYTWIWLAVMIGRVHIAECRSSALERLDPKQREP